MRPQTSSPRRNAHSPLTLEALECRRLLSGLASLLDIHLSPPPGDGPAPLAILRPDQDEAAGPGRTFGAEAAPASHAAVGPLAQVEAAVSRVAHEFAYLAKGVSHDGATPDLGGKHGPPAGHSFPGHGNPLEHDLGLSGRHHKGEGPGFGSSGEQGTLAWFLNAHGLSHARHRSTDDQDDSEGRAATHDSQSDLDTSAREKAAAIHVSDGEATGGSEGGLAEGPKATAEHLIQSHGAALDLTLRLLASDMEDSSGDAARALRFKAARSDSPAAAPAREEGGPETLLAFVGQTRDASLRQATPVDPDERAAALLLPLLAEPGAGRGDWWGWISAGYERPVGDGGEPSLIEFRAMTAESPPAERAGELPAVAAAGAGLAAGSLPGDAAALGQAVREFLNGLDAAGRELTRVLGENSWVRWALAAALAAVLAEAGRRRLQRGTWHGAASGAEDKALSWLSGSCPLTGSST
jgi:hypothetical protein